MDEKRNSRPDRLLDGIEDPLDDEAYDEELKRLLWDKVGGPPEDDRIAPEDRYEPSEDESDDERPRRLATGPRPYTFNFVPRAEWGALPATEPLKRLSHPVDHYTYTFTKTRACNNREDCVRLLQDIQRTHMHAKGLPDIAYNFIIGGDLTVYEGRGWYYKPKQLEDRLAEWDGRTVDIAYMGMPFGGIKNNFYCFDILQLRDQLVEYGMAEEFLDEFALWDRIDVQ